MPDYRAETRRAAQRHGLDPGLFERQIQQESHFDPTARSKYALGIAQLTPDTARAWGVNPMDPIASLDAAAANMASYVKQYGTEGALRAYNAGPGAIKRSKAFAETNHYVATILGGRTPAPGTPRPTAHSSTLSPSSGGSTRTTTTTTPGVDNRAERAKLILSFLQQKGADPVAFAMRARELRDIAPVTDTQTQHIAGPRRNSAPSAPAPSGGDGTALFEGKRVAAWIQPALVYARRQGWKGQVNSGFRSLADQTRIYNSGVRPAAKPGTSNHEGADFPRGAVDVSDAQTLSQILLASPWARRLVYAGTKDPVHFSHPHNGSY